MIVGVTVFSTKEQQNGLDIKYFSLRYINKLLWYFGKFELVHIHLRMVSANGFVPTNMLKLKLKEQAQYYSRTRSYKSFKLFFLPANIKVQRSDWRDDTTEASMIGSVMCFRAYPRPTVTASLIIISYRVFCTECGWLKVAAHVSRRLWMSYECR